MMRLKRQLIAVAPVFERNLRQSFGHSEDTLPRLRAKSFRIQQHDGAGGRAVISDRQGTNSNGGNAFAGGFHIAGRTSAMPVSSAVRTSSNRSAAARLQTEWRPGRSLRRQPLRLEGPERIPLHSRFAASTCWSASPEPRSARTALLISVPTSQSHRASGRAASAGETSISMIRLHANIEIVCSRSSCSVRDEPRDGLQFEMQQPAGAASRTRQAMSDTAMPSETGRNHVRGCRADRTATSRCVDDVLCRVFGRHGRAGGRDQ